MVQINVEFTGFEDYRKQLREIPRAYNTIVIDEMEHLGESILPILRRNTPKASGDLAASSQYQVMVIGDIPSLIVSQPARSRHHGRLYNPYVVHGTHAHLAPILPLLEWVMAKFGMRGRRALNIAYKVRFGIAQKGTRPNPYIAKTITEIEPIVTDTRETIARKFDEFFNP